VTPCGSCKNRRFGGTYRFHHQNEKNLRRLLQLPVTATVVPSSLIPFTLMKEAIGSSETTILTKTTLRHIAEGGILYSHCRENLKSCISY
jgi:hypothetical protein